MRHPIHAIRIVASIPIAAMLASCDSADPGMVEKISLLEAELREKDRRMASMTDELSRRPSGPSTPAAPNLDAARNTYLRYVDQLRDKLASAMPELTFEEDRVSVFPVVGPDPSLPIASKAGFQIMTQDGTRGELVVAFHADFSGTWKDPDFDQIKKSFQPPAPQATPAPPPAPPPAPLAGTQPPKPQLQDVMGADRTVEVQWDDPPKPQPPPGQSEPRQPAPQPPAQPAQPSPALPPKVMPSDRDVIIDFD